MGSMISEHTNEVERVLDAARLLVSQGQHRGAIDLLMDANRGQRCDQIEKALVRVRHDAAVDAAGGPGRTDWPGTYEDLFAGSDGIPEVTAAELSAETIGAGLLHHGSLIVRGLLTEERTAPLIAGIDAAFAGYDRTAADPERFEALPWYSPIQVGGIYSWEIAESLFPRSSGGVMAADSPRMLFEIIEAYRAAGLGEALLGYLGEWPALSVKKFTMRRTEPGIPAGWHQDGAFLGTDIRTANVWVSLTDSGVDAPGLEIVPQRFDTLVEQGTDPEIFAWSVAHDMAVQVGGGRIEAPVFGPGDALILDQMTLHRTGVTPSMTKTRYAIESWFFAPSTYPHEQIPIAF
jgi:hypothetical protein